MKNYHCKLLNNIFKGCIVVKSRIDENNSMVHIGTIGNVTETWHDLDGKWVRVYWPEHDFHCAYNISKNYIKRA